MRRFLRYLRIAFSATCLIVCVLLIALWVRSHYHNDTIFRPVSNGWELFAYSEAGNVGVVYRVQRSNYMPVGWSFISEEKPEWKRKQDAGFSTQFRMQWSATMHSVCVPNWFPPLVFGIVASLPWLRRQFSLRTLLIATTLVAVVLCMIRYLR
jgi:hypothetical protein